MKNVDKMNPFILVRLHHLRACARSVPPLLQFLPDTLERPVLSLVDHSIISMEINNYTYCPCSMLVVLLFFVGCTFMVLARLPL